MVRYCLFEEMEFRNFQLIFSLLLDTLLDWVDDWMEDSYLVATKSNIKNP
jgi:hypothetical protein